MPASPGKTRQREASNENESSDVAAREARETFEKLVAAREALVKAMHFADEAQVSSVFRFLAGSKEGPKSFDQTVLK